MDDRRIFERINMSFPVRFLDPTSGLEGEAETVDISANGLGFVTSKDLSAHTPLEMWLDIPDNRAPLYTRGEVVWSQFLPNGIHQKVGVQLEKAELMGLGRTLRKNRRL
jgi:hypothetical protein